MAAVGRFHHASNGYGTPGAQLLQTVGADGAAGDNHRLQIEAAQKPQILPGIPQQGLLAAVAVGDTGSISKVYNILGGHQLPQLPHRRQPSQSGIEYAYGTRVHTPSLLPCRERRNPAFWGSFTIVL